MQEKTDIRLKTSILSSDFLPKTIFEFQEVADKKSLVRIELDYRYLNDLPFPLSTTSVKSAAIIRWLRLLLNTFKAQIDVAKLIAGGRKATLPNSIKTNVTKIKIPRIPSLKLDGMVYNDTDGLINSEWIEYPDTDSSERVILYIHGGAYVLASRRTHRGITWRLAKNAEAKILAVDYRLAPQHVFPAALIDVLSGYQYLLQKYKPHQISFVGDSAGGALAAAAMIYCRDTGDLPLPGAMDLTQSLPAWHLNKPYCYLPKGTPDKKYISNSRSNLYVSHDKDLINPYASPIFAEQSQVPFPPMMIQVGDAERVRDDGIFFKKLFANENIKLELYEHGVHVFQLFAAFEEFGRESLSRLGDFLKKYTGNDPSTKYENSAVMVRNREGFPEEQVPDYGEIIQDGMDILVQKGVWKHELLLDGTRVVSLANQE
ncbi:hypothetical protein HK103_003837 [Boothiomyces macroporosus]|uniref:Alpha/beta hydrolase fold-3 domain-containing protein n=1 Tax=Boothiomyces macroporosus TaxID=261099 RepID=A0AAD5UPT6_9FUNG|nr:hypothetical protein HK103_003837 [Boothiomyces macroporosus]